MTSAPDAATGAPGPAAVSAPGSTPEISGVQRLSPRVLLFWGVPWAILTLVVALLVGVVGLAADWATVTTVVSVLFTLGVGGLAAVVLPRLRYRRWSYCVTDDRLELSHGVVVRVESSVPHFRVQHIDVRQGPLQRLAGVVDLQISTASAASDATLPGVEPERAEQIRALVLARAEADDAV